MRVVETWAAGGSSASNLANGAGLDGGMSRRCPRRLLDVETRRTSTDVDVELVEGSILDDGVLDRAMDGADAVVHLAARASVPRSIAEPVAVPRGERHRHDAGAGGGPPPRHRRTSSWRRSSSVYGATRRSRSTRTWLPFPVSPYAASKLGDRDVRAGLGATSTASTCWPSGSSTCSGRCSRRPRLRGRGAGVRRRRRRGPAAAGARRRPADPGLHLRRHRVRGHRRRRDPPGVASRAGQPRLRHPVSLLEVIAELERILGRPLERRHTDPRAGDVRDSQADTHRLQALFPAVEPVPLGDGLGRRWTGSARGTDADFARPTYRGRMLTMRCR